MDNLHNYSCILVPNSQPENTNLFYDNSWFSFVCSSFDLDWVSEKKSKIHNKKSSCNFRIIICFYGNLNSLETLKRRFFMNTHIKDYSKDLRKLGWKLLKKKIIKIFGNQEELLEGKKEESSQRTLDLKKIKLISQNLIKKEENFNYEPVKRKTIFKFWSTIISEEENLNETLVLEIKKSEGFEKKGLVAKLKEVFTPFFWNLKRMNVLNLYWKIFSIISNFTTAVGIWTCFLPTKTNGGIPLCHSLYNLYGNDSIRYYI